MDLLRINEKPPGEFKTLLEVSLDHLLVTPPSHFIPQKVRDYFDKFIGIHGRTNILKMYPYLLGSSTGKLLSNSFYFQGKNAKTKNTGTMRHLPRDRLSDKISVRTLHWIAYSLSFFPALQETLKMEDFNS